jgi:exonuclease SbcC
MKIARIKFRNINSLRGEHEVNFESEPLASAGIFAITGATGSGKTTILDVMVLALYNKIPRIGDVISNTFLEKAGALITRNTMEAYAEIEYESTAGRYISKWSVHRARTGKIQQHRMELFDVATGLQLDLKNSEVADKNIELIGLNYDQFIRSILLAQGEFARFLKSDRKERTALLEKITGTDIYRLIGKSVYEKTKAVKSDADAVQQRLNEMQQQIMAEEQLILLHKSLSDAEAEVKRIDAEMKKGKEILGVKEEIASLEVRHSAALRQLATSENNLELFLQSEGARMHQHEKLLPCAQQLLDWERKSEEVKRHTAKEAMLKADIDTCYQQRQAIIAKAAALLQQEPANEIPEAKLTALRTQVEALDKQRDTLKSEFKEKQSVINATGKPLGISAQPKELEAQLAELNSKLQNSDSRVASIRTELKVEGDNYEVLVQQYTQALSLTHEIANANVLLDRNQQDLKHLQDKLHEKQQKAEALPAQITTIRNDLQQMEMSIALTEKDIEISNLKSELEAKRHLLTEGEPCPLCGSVHHPTSGLPVTGEGEELRKKLVALKKQKDISTQQLAHTESDQKFLQQELEGIHSNLRKLEREIAGQHTAIADKHIGLPVALRPLAIDEIIARLESGLKLLEELSILTRSIDILQHIIPDIELLIDLAAKGRQITEERNALYTGNDISGEVYSILSGAQLIQQKQTTAETAFANWQSESETLAGQLAAMESDLKIKVSALGYAQIPDAWQKLLSPEVFSSLQNQKANLEQQVSSGRVGAKGVEEQVQQLKRKDLPIAAEELIITLASLEQELFRHAANRDNMLVQSRRQETLASEVKLFTERLTGINKQGERWLLLAQFIEADAKGEKFSAFAQQLTLERLVLLANNRLIHLNKRYTLAAPSDSEDDSLIICDADMGGNRRSVKTLSGGESFLISLSLALALSDLASHTVEIKSLFIDEGFGTLDPATLEQTLDTLERLQTESNKTIGIISHVDALKERITTQIQLIQNGQGFSILNIV